MFTGRGGASKPAKCAGLTRPALLGVMLWLVTNYIPLDDRIKCINPIVPLAKSFFTAAADSCNLPLFIYNSLQPSKHCCH